MFCRFCGKEIPEDTMYCPHCGKDQYVERKLQTEKVEKTESIPSSSDKTGPIIIFMMSILLVLSPLLKLCSLNVLDLTFSVADMFNAATKIGEIMQWDYVLDGNLAAEDQSLKLIFIYLGIASFFYILAVISFVAELVHLVNGRKNNLISFCTWSSLLGVSTLFASFFVYLLAKGLDSSINHALGQGSVASAFPLTNIYFVVVVVSIIVMILSLVNQKDLTNAEKDI